MRRSGSIRAILAVAGVMTVLSAGVAAPAVAGSIPVGLYAFGTNQFGELGNGTTTTSLSPVFVGGLPGTVRQLATGWNSAGALMSDGTVWTWGSNHIGQLGNPGAGDPATTPQQVPGLSAISQIAMGNEGNGYAVGSDGSVWAWGDNTGGNLGDGTTTSHLTPEQVPGLTGITQVTASAASYALRSYGTLFSWGDNVAGTWGNGSPAGSTFTPAPVPGLTGISQVASDGPSTLALAGSGGTVWAWGDNHCGQLGNGSTRSAAAAPAPVPGPTGVTQVAMGTTWAVQYYSAAVRSDGTLLTWGCNGYGQLGIPGMLITTPTPVTALTGVSQFTFGIDWNGFSGGGYGLAVGTLPGTIVPNLSGDTTTQASQVLQAALLALGTISTVVDRTCNNIGTVMNQNPAAGSYVSYGTVVSVTIGKRPPRPFQCP